MDQFIYLGFPENLLVSAGLAPVHLYSVFSLSIWIMEWRIRLLN